MINVCVHVETQGYQSGDVLIASGYAEGADALKLLASPAQTCNIE